MNGETDSSNLQADYFEIVMKLRGLWESCTARSLMAMDDVSLIGGPSGLAFDPKGRQAWGSSKPLGSALNQLDRN